LPRSWPDAAVLLRDINGHAFTAISDAQWQEAARATFNERRGRPWPAYDRRLARAVGNIDLRRPIPDMWPQFIGLGRVPALVLRGANSDLLSAETLETMVERHPNLRTLTVPGQGHAPMLKDSESIETISTFLAAND